MVDTVYEVPTATVLPVCLLDWAVRDRTRLWPLHLKMNHIEFTENRQPIPVHVEDVTTSLDTAGAQSSGGFPG